MPDVIDYRFVMRRGLAATWSSTNDVLLDGEYGFERDTGRVKIGNGVDGWNALPYAGGGVGGDAFAAATGVDTITAAFVTTPVLADGLQFKVRAAGSNTTTTPTFNPNGLGALALTKLGGVPLAVADISGAGHELIIRYRASPARYELVNPAGLQDVGVGIGLAVDRTDPRKPIISSTLGSIALSGRVSTYASLPAGLGTGDAGKAYYVESDGQIYIWDGAAFPATGSGISFAGTGHYFWRINITANTGTNSYLNVRRLEFRKVAGGLDCTDVNLTGVASASSEADTSSKAAFAFDRNNSTQWGSLGTTKPQWLAYQFLEKVDIKQVVIWPFEDRTPSRSPGAFTVQYSDDGLAWTTAASFSGVSGWVYGTPKLFTVP